jgi:hypothetical protein
MREKKTNDIELIKQMNNDVDSKMTQAIVLRENNATPLAFLQFFISLKKMGRKIR